MKDESRVLRGRIGAAVTHSRYSGEYITRNAHRSFLDRFVDEVDPLRQLDEAERARRAEQAKNAHMARLALKRWKERQ